MSFKELQLFLGLSWYQTFWSRLPICNVASDWPRTFLHPRCFCLASLSTIVLNSRDWSEIVWLPEISCFKINLAISMLFRRRFTHCAMAIPFILLSPCSFSKVWISPSKVTIACYGFCLLRHTNKPACTWYNYSGTMFSVMFSNVLYYIMNIIKIMVLDK